MVGRSSVHAAHYGSKTTLANGNIAHQASFKAFAGVSHVKKKRTHAAKHSELVELDEAACYGCRRFLPFRESSPLRTFWALLEVCLLIYSGTVLPFRLCFLEFHIPDPLPENEDWLEVEFPIDILFWVDLVLHFFNSYRDEDGNEILSFYYICVNYLSHGFWINLIACLPDEAYTWILPNGGTNGMNQAVKIMRLKRVTRLVSILRGGARVARFIQSLWRFKVFADILMSTKWRIVWFLLLFFWSAHLFGCAWYIIAFAHADHESTWVGHREILDESPLYQWVTCVYFTITVFTSVGFGDMSGTTIGEMAFLVFLMTIGTILNSVIAGEIIGMIMRSSEYDEWFCQQQMLVDQMLQHFEMEDSETAYKITYWMHSSQVKKVDSQLGDVKKILTSGVFPTKFQEQLALEAFDGALLKNGFVQIILDNVDHVPRRLVLFLALSGFKRGYEKGEEVYKAKEHPWNLYLVFGGVFAEVHCPAGNLRTDVKDMAPYRLFMPGNYFGETEIFFPSVRENFVRAEEDSTALVISKESLTGLMTEFSEYLPVWKKEATFRKHRGAFFKWAWPNCENNIYLHLLAMRVQRWYWNRKAKRSLGCSGELNDLDANCNLIAADPEGANTAADQEVAQSDADQEVAATDADQQCANADAAQQQTGKLARCRSKSESLKRASSVDINAASVSNRLLRLEQMFQKNMEMLSEYSRKVDKLLAQNAREPDIVNL